MNSDTCLEMKNSWEEKAEVNAYHWVDSTKKDWKDAEEYYDKGKEDVLSNYIRPLERFGFRVAQFNDSRALDIGCGTGRLCRGLSHFFLKVDGVDISSKMLEIAERDNRDVSKIDFHKGNGIDLSNFSSETFNFIFSFIVFQHIPKKTIVNNYIKEIHRTLKDGGVARFQVRGYPGLLRLGTPSLLYKGFNSFYCAVELRKGFIPVPVCRKYNTVYGAFYKKEELISLLEETGFEVLEVSQDPNNHRYLWATVHKGLRK